MKVKIYKVKPEKFPENEVKTHQWKMPYRSSSIVLHPEGLFSNKIFGRLERCECGKLKTVGYCKQCETRIVDINNLPDYWFDMGVKILSFMPEWHELKLDRIRLENIKQVLEYTHFVYINPTEDGTDFTISVEEMPDVSQGEHKKFKNENIYIGEKAAMLLGADQDWLDKNMTDVLLIPHPNYRPLIRGNDGKPLMTDINEHYVEIIKQCNNIKELLKFSSSNLHDLVSRCKVTEIYKKINEELQDVLQGSKFSVMRSEIIAHPISGAVRGTLLNGHNVNEDILLIGDQFVESLYPYLYKKHDGNMKKINDELIEKDYVLMLNRPPSISYMSTMGMKPRIASIYPRLKMEGTKGALLKNDTYTDSDEYVDNNYYVQGDIEGIHPQYIGRKNYDNIPQQLSFNKRPTKIKRMSRTPYDVIYPIDNLGPRKRDRNAKPIKDTYALDARDFKYRDMEEIEVFLYKHGMSVNNLSSKIIDKINELRYIDSVETMEIKHNIKELDLWFDAQLMGKDLPSQYDESEVVESLALSIIQSKNLNYRALCLKKKSVKNAYGLKKADIQELIKSALVGYDIYNKIIAEKLDSVCKANLLLTHDNRRSYDFISADGLASAVDDCGDILSDEFDTLLESKIKTMLERLEVGNKYYKLIVESGEESGYLNPEDRAQNIEMIAKKRKELIKETAKHISKLYRIEYFRMQNMFKSLNIKVRNSENEEFYQLTNLADRNSDSLKLKREESKSKVEEYNKKMEVLEKEMKIAEDLLEFIRADDKNHKKYFTYDGDQFDLGDGRITKSYNTMREIKRDITSHELEIKELAKKISDEIEGVGSTKVVDVENLYMVNGKLNGTSYIEDTDIEDFVEFIDADGILVENVRGITNNPITCDGQASDYDGDCLLVIAIYSEKAMDEVRGMLSSNRYMNYADGRIRNGIVEDFFYCAENETQETAK